MKPKLQSLMQQTDNLIKEEEKKKPSAFRKTFRWLYIFSLAFVLSFLLTASGLFIGSLFDSSFKEIKFQNPIQTPFYFEVKEHTAKAVRPAVSVKTASKIAPEPKSDVVIANHPKAQQEGVVKTTGKR
jgi:hypothetical protein